MCAIADLSTVVDLVMGDTRKFFHDCDDILRTRTVRRQRPDSALCHDDVIRTFSTRILFRKVTYARCLLPVTVSILECGPMPNVMVALPNIGGAICSTPQSLADAHYLTAMQ